MSIRRRFVGLALLSGCIAALALTSVVAQSGNRRFVPLTFSQPFGAITFGTSADANGIPSPPTTDIPPGTRVLYYNARITGGARSLPYRLEWSINGQAVDGLARSGTVIDNPDDIAGSVCFTRVTDPDCSNPTGTLQPGTYTLRLFVNNLQVAESTATVRAALDGSDADPEAQPKSAQ